MSDKDIFTQTTDADEVTAESPEPTKRQQTSMANALWRDGHKHGYVKGMAVAHKSGRSTLSYGWFFIVSFLFLFGGFIAGVGGDFIARCGPEIPCTIQTPNWGFAPITVEDVQ